MASGGTHNKRAASFTSAEEAQIMDMLEKFKHIINKKGGTNAVNAGKQKVWQRVADKLNRLV